MKQAELGMWNLAVTFILTCTFVLHVKYYAYNNKHGENTNLWGYVR